MSLPDQNARALSFNTQFNQDCVQRKGTVTSNYKSTLPSGTHTSTPTHTRMHTHASEQIKTSSHTLSKLNKERAGTIKRVFYRLGGVNMFRTHTHTHTHTHTRTDQMFKMFRNLFLQF